MFSFRFTSGVGKHTKTILSCTMGQKLSSKLLFITSPNTDGFYRFHISQSSVATQLSCGGMLVTTLSYTFSTECASEKFKNRSIGLIGKDMDKSLWLTFWATLYILCAQAHLGFFLRTHCQINKSLICLNFSLTKNKKIRPIFGVSYHIVPA